MDNITLEEKLSFAKAISAYHNPLDRQVAGDHYKKLKIQPVEYIHANDIGFCEGNVIKYVSRWKFKGGIADLQKAKHIIELLIQLEGVNNAFSFK